MTEVYGKTTVKAPYSVAMDAIVRYLKAKKNRIVLVVPLKALGLGTSLGLEREVDVAFLPLRGHKGERLLHDELQLSWTPTGGGPFPNFTGALKMHPLGNDTELVLSGEYQPPMGVVGEAFDAVIGKRMSEATAQELLEAIRSGLEADFAAVKETIEGTPRP
ncbi:MAG: hypothetical protein JO241_05875 [Candidatus Eremiobacteraeota bacterium]|nr:hypothetical protein [Candidatus Eremiobacteraeota bacterium]